MRPGSDQDVIVVLTTVPDEATGESLARRLLDARVIACANIFPGARSLYRWEGEIRREEEAVVVLKTVAGEMGRLGAAIAEHHPYSVPELLALPVADGGDAYLAWVRAEVGGCG